MLVVAVRPQLGQRSLDAVEAALEQRVGRDRRAAQRRRGSEVQQRARPAASLVPVGGYRAQDAVPYQCHGIIAPANRDRGAPHCRAVSGPRPTPSGLRGFGDRHAGRLPGADGGSPCRSRAPRTMPAVQFQDISGQNPNTKAVRLRPFPEAPPQIVRFEGPVLRGGGDEDRLGQIVVVRIAGGCCDFTDAVRKRFGDSSSRPALLHDSQKIAGCNACHRTAGAVGHVIRLQGTSPCRAVENTSSTVIRGQPGHVSASEPFVQRRTLRHVVRTSQSNRERGADWPGAPNRSRPNAGVGRAAMSCSAVGGLQSVRKKCVMSCALPDRQEGRSQCHGESTS